MRTLFIALELKIILEYIHYFCVIHWSLSGYNTTRSNLSTHTFLVLLYSKDVPSRTL